MYLVVVQEGLQQSWLLSIRSGMLGTMCANSLRLLFKWEKVLIIRLILLVLV